MGLFRNRRRRPPRALVVGWFSLAFGGATAGDLAALEVARRWLTEAGWDHDVALGEPLQGGVDWRAVSPDAYSHVIHVCGPVGEDMEVARILERFADCELVALNVSVIGDWNPFAHRLARDGAGPARPDLAFLANGASVPVVGVVLVHPQLEYADGRHDEVEAAVGTLLAERACASVPIDTRLDLNPGGLRTVEEVESLISHMDVVIASRLHGLVFALRSGVPAVAIDPIAGGAKVASQAAAVGWPAVVRAGELDRLGEQFDWCLTDEARMRARECAEAARAEAERIRGELLEALGPPA